MLLSTPNLENAGSKASFLRSGFFLWFHEEDHEGHGHITPLTQWQIEKAFFEAGFRFRWKGSFGESASGLAGSPRLRLLARLVAMISSADPQLSGEIFVAILEKPRESKTFPVICWVPGALESWPAVQSAVGPFARILRRR
jgi:hypothetical protein